MSKTPKTVDHLGQVVEITLNDVKVSITSKSACSGCHAKGACGMADSTEKIVAVNKPNHNYFVGQSVKVILKKSLGFRALFIGYILPLIFVITSLVIMLEYNYSELWSGLFSLFILALYYIVLYIFKDNVSQKFVFDIESIQ